MSPWVTKAGRGVRRYAGLLGVLVKIGFMRQMAYRPHFYLMITGKVIRIALVFFFFQAIFLKVDRIGSWTYDEVLLLFATFHIVDYLMSITFHRTLAYQLPGRVQSGELDWRMLLPVNLLFFVSFEEVDIIDLFSFLPSLAFLMYVFHRLDFAFSWPQLAAYVLLMANALLFVFAVVLITATVSFWTTQSYGLSRIFDNLLKIGRYPLDIFQGFWKIVFVYFLPLVLIAQVPSQALLRALDPKFLLAAMGASAFFLVLALAFWRVGLRNYVSASS
ncbi:MAG: ABC-2 family transporter protein [bacterium]